jgi:hypothetical protein
VFVAAIGGIISAAVQLIVGLFTAFIQFITGDFSGAWQTLQKPTINCTAAEIIPPIAVKITETANHSDWKVPINN